MGVVIPFTTSAVSGLLDGEPPLGAIVEVTPLITTLPDEAREKVVPWYITGEPPADKVSPLSRMYPERSGSAVAGTKPTGAPTRTAIEVVWPLTTSAAPELSNEYVDAPTVIAGPPGKSVSEPM